MTQNNQLYVRMSLSSRQDVIDLKFFINFELLLSELIATKFVRLTFRFIFSPFLYVLILRDVAWRRWGTGTKVDHLQRHLEIDFRYCCIVTPIGSNQFCWQFLLPVLFLQ